MECVLCKSPNPRKVPIGETITYTCSHCDLMFVPDFGNELEFHSAYFEKTRQQNEHLNSLRNKQYLLDVDHLINHVSTGSLLDIGCSKGQFINLLNEKGTFDYLVGIDIDQSAIKFARETIKDSKIDFNCIDPVDFESEHKFDVIVFRGTLQYMSSNLTKVFAKLKSLLTRGGRIIIYSLPNKDSFIFHLIGEHWSLFNPQEHKLFFNEKSIAYLASQFDFSIEELSYPYRGTPYENLSDDYQTVTNIIQQKIIKSPPFWGNIIQLIFINRDSE